MLVFRERPRWNAMDVRGGGRQERGEIKETHSKEVSEGGGATRTGRDKRDSLQGSLRNTIESGGTRIDYIERVFC